MVGAADRVRRARRAPIDAVTASWPIGSRDDGPCKHRSARQVNLPDLRQPAGEAARPRERASKAERGAGSVAALPRSGAALDQIRLNSATQRSKGGVHRRSTGVVLSAGASVLGVRAPLIPRSSLSDWSWPLS
jgi:hypothetical protein